LFEERTQQQQQVLRLELPANLPLITTDRRYLERIMTELLTNACKYTPPGERIIVSVQVQSAPSHPPNFASEPIDRSFLLLRVTNYGIEIPASEHDRIFQTFYRIPNTDPWRYGGTGLGLALVKKLVERLHGKIQLESRLGWTCFTIQLPL
ncbi:MAG TPA: ATP-binding protein, partial [Allocoleopsis sp.]